MVAPALATIAYDLRITDHIQSQMVLSIFVLAFVIGPFLLGPLSEIYGRVRVLQIANVMFLVFNTACGAAKSTTQMLIFRFLSGIGGSAPLSVSSPALYTKSSNSICSNGNIMLIVKLRRLQEGLSVTCSRQKTEERRLPSTVSLPSLDLQSGQ